jgi:hypothetical protein
MATCVDRRLPCVLEKNKIINRRKRQVPKLISDCGVHCVSGAVHLGDIEGFRNIFHWSQRQRVGPAEGYLVR